MEIVPLGDSALIVRVCDRFDDAPDETSNAVLHTFRRLEAAAIPGVTELAPAYTTVAIFFDLVQVTNAGARPDQVFDWLAERVRAAVAPRMRGDPGGAEILPARVVEIPVCYASEFALDLDCVAGHAQISSGEVVDLHSAAKYRVSCIGFVPGFPFLTGLPKKLATPRQATPRKEIPAGSVAIGGAQTGIYPLRSPGGWNIIGRTSLRLFDAKNSPPSLLRVGDRVRFRAVTREEFDLLKG